jgi:hypothetical protein
LDLAVDVHAHIDARSSAARVIRSPARSTPTGVRAVLVTREPGKARTETLVADIVLWPGARQKDVLDDVRRTLAERLARYRLASQRQ